MKNETTEKRYCKKCGCELTSDNKSKYCLKHREERTEKWQKGLALGLSVASTIAIIPRIFFKK